ncbi:MAG: UbiX family flavin prenyltransferase [Planctomycetota bacterium]
MTKNNDKKRIVVAVTGASGTVYGIRLIEALCGLGHEVAVVLSDAGSAVMRHECVDAPDFERLGVARYGDNDIGAPIASGSYRIDGMVICPCTMATLSAVACGRATNLTHRAADVALKEGRRLILVPRETPLNRIHIQNMLTAHDAGAVIMPAMPPFYGNPKSLHDLISHMVGKILDRLDIDNPLAARWEGGGGEE